MAWIELHQSLVRSPKALRLAKMLNIPLPQAIGHLVCLWLWCLDYALDGDLHRYTDRELAAAAQTSKRPEAFLEAMHTCGFLDRDQDGYTVHDWLDYTLKLIESREKAGSPAAEKQRRYRENKKALRNAQVTPEVTQVTPLPPTVPNPTQPNPTVTKHADDPAASEDEYKLRTYWAKVKKGKPPTLSDREAIISALQLPGMTYDRIHSLVDPLVEFKRKQGKDVGGFAYFLPVLAQEVGLAKMRSDLSAAGLAGAPQVIASASKPRIQDRDHYEVLVAMGSFNRNEWANAQDFEEDDF